MGDVIRHCRTHDLRILIETGEKFATFMRIEKADFLPEIGFEQLGA